MSKTYNEQYLVRKIDKIPVKYAHIISRVLPEELRMNRHAHIYYEIEYKPIDENVIRFGFGSYALDLVLGWLKSEFDIRGDVNG